MDDAHIDSVDLAPDLVNGLDVVFGADDDESPLLLQCDRGVGAHVPESLVERAGFGEELTQIAKLHRGEPRLDRPYPVTQRNGIAIHVLDHDRHDRSGRGEGHGGGTIVVDGLIPAPDHQSRLVDEGVEIERDRRAQPSGDDRAGVEGNQLAALDREERFCLHLVFLYRFVAERPHIDRFPRPPEPYRSPRCRSTPGSPEISEVSAPCRAGPTRIV